MHVSYAHAELSNNRSKCTEVIVLKMKCLLSDLDLAPRYLSSIHKLCHYLLFLATVTFITDNWVAIPISLILATQILNLVLKGLSKLKILSRNLFPVFSNSDLDLDQRCLGSNPKLPLDISYPNPEFGVNRSKQTQVMDRNLLSVLVTVTLTLIKDAWVAIPSCLLT